jgi:hypothetical protein
MSDRITVQILLHGEPREMTIPLQEGVTAEWVENKVRSTFGVINGTLSSYQDIIEVVLSLVAGSVYYFVQYRATPACKYLSRILCFHDHVKEFSIVPSYSF